ncbi:MAG: pseudouridine synthase family protein [Candidatus Margulisiibacteriota bacterium]
MAELLVGFFKGKQDPRVVVDGGGVWKGKTRITQVSTPVEAQETLTVFVSASPQQQFILDPSQIILEHADWVVVNKPAALATVSDHANLHWNLTAGVWAYLQAKGSRYQPTAINRLDIGVSGLVLFPKHKAAEKKLFALMQARKIAKRYTAILGPHVPRPWVRISNYLLFTKKAQISESPAGKLAQSVFVWQKTVAEGEVYRVVIRTGRRHQIRVHAAHHLAPIVGDTLYGSPAICGKTLCLVADYLKFWWRNVQYKIQLPE